jgi:hypothetical protein
MFFDWKLHWLPTELNCEFKVKVTLRLMVGQSVSKSHDQIFIAVWQLRSSFLWGVPSHERTGLSFVHGAGPCQSSLSWVRVPWESRPYFTVSDLRLPFSSPPTTLRVTVEVFDPASTRVSSELNWTGTVKYCWLLVIWPRVGPQYRKHIRCLTTDVPYCCVFAGAWLLCRCLAMGLHVTIFSYHSTPNWSIRLVSTITFSVSHNLRK